MCRHLAYLGPPVTLESLLVDPPHGLVRQAWAPRHQDVGRINADGFGVGWYDRARRLEPARYRTTRPMWTDSSFASLAGLTGSGAVMASVRAATPPSPVETSSNAPFTSGPWLFSHNGTVNGFHDPSTGLRVKLGRLVSERRAGGIEGCSDSEVLFALVLDRLDDGASLGDALVDVTATVLGLTTGRINLLLTDGQDVAATAWGSSLFTLRGTGLAAGGLVVASEPCDDEPGWTAVADGTLVEGDVSGLSNRSMGSADAGVAPPQPQQPQPAQPAQRPQPAQPAQRPQPPTATVVAAPPLEVTVHLQPAEIESALLADVRAGLGSRPRRLSPRWLYDDRGSELFDAITRLPEYYPTLREREILIDRAAEIAALTKADTLVELGSGTSEKTGLLLEALERAGNLRRFIPLDVSEATLRAAAASIADAYPALTVQAVVGDFVHHAGRLPGGGRRLVAFLGGTIGNLEPSERASLLADLAGGLEPGDALLLGTDLVKDPARLVAAYDDGAGVTAEFNKNLLHMLNRELGANFASEYFEHVARWDPDQQWMEMRLRSTRTQSVTLPRLRLEIELRDGEEIRTEISAKFRKEVVDAELTAAGLDLAEWWTDPAGDYALSLSFA